MSFLSEFKGTYSKEALKLVSLVYNASNDKVHSLVNTEINSFERIFTDMFKGGKEYSQTVVKKELLDLVDTIKVPFKYDRNVINKINDVSIFNGYYDEAYQGVFTKRELYNLKSTLLSGKYSGLSEREIADNVKNVINVSDKRALLLARTEQQRLQETTTRIYYEEPKVREVYDRVWDARDDAKTRPEHNRMDGKKAETKGEHAGEFLSEDVGWVNGPGSGPTSFSIGCRCKTRLVKREKA